MVTLALVVFAVFAAHGIESASDCKWIGVFANSTSSLVPPEVCTATSRNVGAYYTSTIYHCVDAQSALKVTYNNSKSCDTKNGGTVLSETWFNATSGYNLNCAANAVDCSSVYRVYVNCTDSSCTNCAKTSAYNERAIVTATCQVDIYGNKATSSIWQCNAHSQWRYNYDNNGACTAPSSSVANISTGCIFQTGVWMYNEITTCNMPKVIQ
eukprot:CAMPEP_0197034524 /NCGR_PEP_ID=MMETSP1384-20130603/12615_1 /TAXON_ID=29189 /ORGANISM="Ammonia sp." /LENGTH=210 /DNA_ID=CAMNT_0042464467 /DNA_START=20 /DNA_END=652 /DNA_ORIENTATION=-